MELSPTTPILPGKLPKLQVKEYCLWKRKRHVTKQITSNRSYLKFDVLVCDIQHYPITRDRPVSGPSQA